MSWAVDFFLVSCCFLGLKFCIVDQIVNIFVILYVCSYRIIFEFHNILLEKTYCDCCILYYCQRMNTIYHLRLVMSNLYHLVVDLTDCILLCMLTCILCRISDRIVKTTYFWEGKSWYCNSASIPIIFLSNLYEHEPSCQYPYYIKPLHWILLNQ